MPIGTGPADVAVLLEERPELVDEHRLRQQQAGAAAGGAGERRRGHPAEPQARADALDGVEHGLEHAPAAVAPEPERVELGVAVAEAQPELEPAAGDRLERLGASRERDGVVLRPDQHRLPEVEARRAGGRERLRVQELRAEPVVPEPVLRGPDGVEAQRVGVLRRVGEAPVDRGRVPRARRRGLERPEPDAERVERPAAHVQPASPRRTASAPPSTKTTWPVTRTFSGPASHARSAATCSGSPGPCSGIGTTPEQRLAPARVVEAVLGHRRRDDPRRDGVERDPGARPALRGRAAAHPADERPLRGRIDRPRRFGLDRRSARIDRCRLVAREAGVDDPGVEGRVDRGERGDDGGPRRVARREQRLQALEQLHDAEVVDPHGHVALRLDARAADDRVDLPAPPRSPRPRPPAPPVCRGRPRPRRRAGRRRRRTSPAAASRSAVARPMPEPEPVTTTVRLMRAAAPSRGPARGRGRSRARPRERPTGPSSRRRRRYRRTSAERA